MKIRNLRLAGVLLAGLLCAPAWAQTILTATVPALALGSYSAQQPNGVGLVVGSINAQGTFRTIVNGANQYLMVVYPAAGSGYSTYTVGIDTQAGGTINITSLLTNALPAQVSPGGGATIPATTNLLNGDGSGNGADSAIAPGNVVQLTATQTLTNKTLDGVTPTTMALVDPTSSIQTQLNGKQASGTYVTPTTLNNGSLPVNASSVSSTGSVSAGASPPLCGTGADGCLALGASTVAGTPAAGKVLLQANSGATGLNVSYGGAAFVPLVGGQLGNTIIATTGPTTQTIVSSLMTAIQTTVPVVSTAGYATPTTAAPIALILSNSNHGSEIVTCTGTSGGTSFTGCTRGQSTTTAVAWEASGPTTTVSEISFAVQGKAGAPWPIIQMWNGPTWIGSGANFAPANTGNLFGIYGIFSGDNNLVISGVSFVSTSAHVGDFNSGSGYGINLNGSNYFVDGEGITSAVNGTQATVAGTTSLTPASGVLVLTGTAPTSAGLLTIVPNSSAASCSVTTSVSCSFTIINTTSGSITTGSGTAANDFALAYTLPAKSSMTCTGYGATRLWYCTR